MLQKETVRKLKPQSRLKHITNKEGYLKIPVLHLSQPILLQCIHILFLHPAKQVIYPILQKLKLSSMPPAYRCLQAVY